MNENTQIAVGVLAVVIIGGLVYSFKDKLMGTGTDPNNGTNNGGNTSGGNTSGGNTSGGNTSGGNTSGGNTSGGNTSGGNTSGGNTSGGTTNTAFPLQKGSKGTNVKALQEVLNSKFNAKLTTDGSFGSKTETALKAATGKISITESEFNALKTGTSTPGTSGTSTYVNQWNDTIVLANEGTINASTDLIISYATQVREDVYEFWGVRDKGLYETINTWTNKSLLELAASYLNSYRVTLAKDIKDESNTTQHMRRIVRRLTDLGKA